MRYLDVAGSLTGELAGRGPIEAVRAGLRLVVRAWRELGDTDGGWDRFGLWVLAAEELVRGLTAVDVACDPPSAGPELWASIERLLAAVADRLELASRDDVNAVADRLAFDAAAGLLRYAVGLLP